MYHTSNASRAGPVCVLVLVVIFFAAFCSLLLPDDQSHQVILQARQLQLQELKLQQLQAQVQLLRESQAALSATPRPTLPHTALPPSTTPTAATALPACITPEDVAGGGMVNTTNGAIHYQPKGCSLTAYNKTTLRECLAHRNLAIFGDSQLREVTYATAARLGYPGSKENMTSEITGKRIDAGIWVGNTANMSFFFTPQMATHPEDHNMRVNFNHTRGREALRDADIIFINAGMWDMGRNCGVQRFYAAFKRYIALILERKKPSAQVVMFGLRWIHRDRCTPRTKECYTCNHPDKVAVFREALFLAASCMGILSVDPSHFSRLRPNNTVDGVHYSGDVRRMEGDLLMNAICRTPALQPVRLPCDEERFFKKWSAVKLADYSCQDKIDKSKCKMEPARVFLSRYEGQAFEDSFQRSRTEGGSAALQGNAV